MLGVSCYAFSVPLVLFVVFFLLIPTLFFIGVVVILSGVGLCVVL